MTLRAPPDQAGSAAAAQVPEALRGFVTRWTLRRFADTAGVDWFYRDTLGSGPVVVFLPGAAGGGDAAFRLVERMQDRCRCISVTYPGGLSRLELAQGLLDLLDHLALDRVFVWGSSYGAWWAQEFARQSKHRVSGLWIGNTLSGGVDVAHLPLFNEDWLESTPADAVHTTWLEAVSQQPPSELRTLQLYFIAHSLPADNLRGRLLQVARAPRLAPAPGIARMVVLDCANDPIIGAGARDHVASLYPHATRLRLTEGGHYPHLTHPDALLPAIWQWLDEA